MSNPLYIYIYIYINVCIRFLREYFVDNIIFKRVIAYLFAHNILVSSIQTLIILFDINHLFAHILNSFKFCYFSVLDKTDKTNSSHLELNHLDKTNSSHLEL